MTASSTTGVGKTGQLHAREWNWITVYPIQKIKLQMDQRPECKSGNNKTLRKKHRQKSLEYKHQQLFPEYISSGKGSKIKNEQIRLHQTKKLLFSKGHYQ